MKITINKDICTGCGTCAALCSEVFELGEDLKSQVKKDANLEKNEVCIKEAVTACPVQAITSE